MKTATQSNKEAPLSSFSQSLETATLQLQAAITKSWHKTAPFWPLKNMIAVNPLQGLEDLPIEQAMVEAATYFQQNDLPQGMEAVNRETIKWCQVFFDEGQATISTPYRQLGLYGAWRRLAFLDKRLWGKDTDKQKWLSLLPEQAEAAIAECLSKLNIPVNQYDNFLTLLLTTLPGWAGHIKYRCHWTKSEPLNPHPVSESDYLAIRIVITYLLYPEAFELLSWHRNAWEKESQMANPMETIEKAETDYLLPLLKALSLQTSHLKEGNETADAQLIFCIDVRSEPFRRALEAGGNYETFGFAGFFGVPIRIANAVSGESYSSCPVLLSPKYTIKKIVDVGRKQQQVYKIIKNFTRFYQSVKYTFTTPFALVETLGLASGIWLGLKTLAPKIAIQLKAKVVSRHGSVSPVLDGISLKEQCAWAEGALRMMGLTRNFAPLVVFCGHGSATQNNAYATALDCGACGGRHGASNARILAAILNNSKVRGVLSERKINVPDDTYFVAAEHNTTTDQVEIYDYHVNDSTITQNLLLLKEDLEVAKKSNSRERAAQFGLTENASSSVDHTYLRSVDWAQVRSEWGLARNAAFVVAPRSVTKNLNLEGRSFLHSYDSQQDPDGASLSVILTAPMVVAQWINSQYLFSTLDNVAFGGGSKITQNITGKIGIMQGNASDLMNGLPLQSVFRTDNEPYHQPLRLITVVCAPRTLIDKVISQQTVLKKLFGNGWVTLACIEPGDNQTYFLERSLIWTPSP